jgi:methyl-accepting chemotaxis protein
MAQRRYRRRRILIENYQYRLLLINMMHFFTILLIFAAALFLPLILQLKSGGLSEIEQGEVASQFLSLHARVWPAMIVVFVLLALHSVIISHRIAGPLYRFRTVFKAVADGDLVVRATLRKTDYLEKESDGLNAMVGSLRAKITELHQEYEEVHAALRTLAAAVRGRTDGDLHRKIEGLQAHIERVKATLSQFRIHPAEKADQDVPVPPVDAPRSPEGSAPIARS